MESESKIKIVPFFIDFQNQIISIIVNIQQNEFNLSITAEDQPALMNIPNFYQKGKGNFWIALNKNKVVGTISLLDIDNDQGALRKMFVRKEYRGIAIGTANYLLETLLKWSRLNGIHEIFLGTTPKFLAVHRFYEKNGLNEIQKNQLPEKFPVMKVDKKFYKYLL